MDQNIFFTLLNSVIAALTIVVFYPVFKAKHANDLNAALKTRPLLAKAIARKNSRSYISSSIYCAISFAVYGVLALGSNVEVDLNLATVSLVILFVIKLAKVWKLRRLLDSPAFKVATQ